MHALYAVAACVLLCGAQEPDIAKRAAAAQAWGDNLLRDDAWRP